MLNFVKTLRPLSIDAWVGCKQTPAAKAWKFFRASTLDRALYWGLTIAFVLPWLMSLLGGGFTFVASATNIAVVSLTFWLLSVASSVVIGYTIKRLTPAAITRPLQELNIAATFAALLWLMSGWFSAALSVSTLGVFIGAAVLWLVSTWSFGGWQKVCNGKCENCACKAKQKEPEDCGCGK
jgi:hypothetical protein